MITNSILKQVLDKTKQRVKDDWDAVILCTGKEGSGKSCLAMQIGHYLDPAITLDRIVFDKESFIAAVKAAKPYDAVIFDEAYGSMASARAMSKINFAIRTMLAEIRAKNLYFILVCPSFFDIEKYVAIHRSNFLLVTMLHKGMRGFFAFYNQTQKQKLYVLGRREMKYTVARASFIGRFEHDYPLGETAYKKKKLDMLNAKNYNVN